jgi:hypothetical protein
LKAEIPIEISSHFFLRKAESSGKHGKSLIADTLIQKYDLVAHSLTLTPVPASGSGQ